MKRVILGALLLMSSISLVGCSSGASPKEVSQNFVNDLEKGNLSDAKTMTINQSTSNLDLKDEKIADTIYSKMSADFGNETINGDHATVDVKVTSLDITKIMASTLQSAIGSVFANAFSGSSDNTNNQNMVEQTFEKEISDPNAPKTTTDTQINLVKDKNGQWKIDSNNDAFVSALTGNVAKVLNNMGQ